jgi:hypothetical protein
MLQEISALWLVVLIVLPFSAPFPTCDVSDLFGRAARHQTPAPGPLNHAALDDATTLLVPPVSATAGRLKLTALSGLRTVHSVAPMLMAAAESPTTVSSQLGTVPQFADILRI